MSRASLLVPYLSQLVSSRSRYSLGLKNPLDSLSHRLSFLNPHLTYRAQAGGDRRGVFAPFIAIITTSLLVLGSIAYDAPRLLAARQDALHSAFEAANIAAATVASGGTVAQAQEAAQDHLTNDPLIYNVPIQIESFECVGTRVEITVSTEYEFRSVFRVVWPEGRRDITATGAAEALLVLPSGEAAELSYLAECPLAPSS